MLVFGVERGGDDQVSSTSNGVLQFFYPGDLISLVFQVRFGDQLVQLPRGFWSIWVISRGGVLLAFMSARGGRCDWRIADVFWAQWMISAVKLKFWAVAIFMKKFHLVSKFWSFMIYLTT